MAYQRKIKATGGRHLVPHQVKSKINDNVIYSYGFNGETEKVKVFDYLNNWSKGDAEDMAKL